MPALSPTMTSGSLTKWLVKVGDQVKAGDIIAEIETDKATMEVETVDEGLVTNLFFEEGDESIPVNEVIAMLNSDGNDQHIPHVNKEKNNVEDKKNIKINASYKKEKNLLDDNFKLNQTNNDLKKIIFSDNKIIASPFAKKLAIEKNIDLLAVSGTGPNGRIIKRDIENLNNKIIPNKKDFSSIKIEGDLPSNMRKIIAQKTTKTKQTVPHFYLTIESNVDKLLLMRKKINNDFDIKISINDILVKALAYSQNINPLTNVSWVNDRIIKHKSVDVSVAVALNEGLVTPIIKNADKKGLKEISNEIKYLANKAKEGTLSPEEYTGGSISISNLGMFGITEFSAIINPPQSSILAIGAIKKIPYLVKDEIKAANILKATLSADHRVLDGAVAGKLLKDFNDIIEDPYKLWLMSEDMEII